MMVTAGECLWMVVGGKIWMRGSHIWESVKGPEDILGQELRVVELAATVEDDVEDGHTFKVFTLYAICDSAQMFVSDRYGRWMKISAP